jgi:hypothetical protein
MPRRKHINPVGALPKRRHQVRAGAGKPVQFVERRRQQLEHGRPAGQGLGDRGAEPEVL